MRSRISGVGLALLAAAYLALSCSVADRTKKMRATARPLYAAEARSDYGMVSTGSVEATRAGVWALERGGNAVDAAVAAAFALGVADPGGSGLGGLTYIVISAADGSGVAIDGSTPAPYVVDHKKLQAIKEAEGRFGHAVVSVPTTLATLTHALETRGTMSLAEVLTPAIETADRGARLTANTVGWATGYMKEILASRHMRFLVLEDGLRIGEPGDRFCRPELARTLRRIAAEGAGSFYRGSIAQEINADMARNGGYLRLVDLARYRVGEAQPLRSSYRGAEIVTFPPPGGGGEVVETLNILETFSSTFLAGWTAERNHVTLEASRLAQADAGAAAGALPGMGRPELEKTHAMARASLITPGRAIPTEMIGGPSSVSALGEHTTQVSVVDRDGNAVSLTQTLCRQFGSKVATPGLGFPYNSCLEFLEFEDPRSPIYLTPGGTFPTNMAPTILRSTDTTLALGSAGSDRIPPSICQVVSNIIDRGMDLRDAVTAPRVIWNSAHDPGRVCIEVAEPLLEADAEAVRRIGFETIYVLRYPPDPVADSAFFGGVNAASFNRRTGVFTGVGDPRRDGYAAGPRVAAQSEAGR